MKPSHGIPLDGVTREASYLALLRQTFDEWLDDGAPTLGAALAYYSAFSMAPLAMIVLGIVGTIFGDEAARRELHNQLQNVMGSDVAAALEGMIAETRKPSRGIAATIIGFTTLLVGASGVFGQLQSSLNILWDVDRKPTTGLWGLIRDRFFSFTLVLGTAFLLLVSLVLSTAINLLGAWMSRILPAPEFILQALNSVISFGIITFLFAAIFKWLPDVKVKWKDVWIGAVITAALFTLGKLALGIYLGYTAANSGFGAAGSLVLILLWVYYSSQILFFGAEFTQVHARASERPKA